MESPVPGPDRSPSRLRPAAWLLLKVAVSACLLVVLLTRIDLGRLATHARQASPAWLAVSVALFGVNVLVSAWRWKVLLRAQAVMVPGRTLVASYLVAGFYNNFLPSNIGGDVVRVADTAGPAGSKTAAATVILVDRGFGLLGLIFVAAVAASIGGDRADPTVRAAAPVLPWMLWLGFGVSAGVSLPALLAPRTATRVLRPLRLFHREWVEERLERITRALGRFGEAPRALAACFAGAVVVQALLVLFYVAIVRSMAIPVSPWQLALIVPITFLVQMLPVSINGFGVREAVFAVQFARLGLPVESALAVSFVGAGLVMLFSLVGVPVHLARRTSPVRVGRVTR